MALHCQLNIKYFIIQFSDLEEFLVKYERLHVMSNPSRPSGLPPHFPAVPRDTNAFAPEDRPDLHLDV